jgi:GNAT superfamily N-acetyltransferase
MPGTAPFLIRRAGVADAEIIARHRVEMFRDMGTLADVHADALFRESTEALKPLLADGEYLGWIAAAATDPADIAGGGGVHLMHRLPRVSLDRTSVESGPIPLIVNVYTAPHWRRRGVARALMESILRWADETGFGGVILHASADGRRLYEQLGFTPTNEMRRLAPRRDT